MKKFIAYLLAATVVISCAYYRFVIYRPTDKNAIPADDIIYNVSEFIISGNYDFDGNISTISEELKATADGICKKYNSTAVQIAVIENCGLKYTYEYDMPTKHQKAP